MIRFSTAIKDVALCIYFTPGDKCMIRFSTAIKDVALCICFTPGDKCMIRFSTASKDVALCIYFTPGDKCMIRFSTAIKDVALCICFTPGWSRQISLVLMKVNRPNTNFSINRSDKISVTFTSTKKIFWISEVKLTCEPVTCISNWTLHTAAD